MICALELLSEIEYAAKSRFNIADICFLALLAFYGWYVLHIRKEERLERKAVEEYKAKGWIASDQKVEL